MRRETRYAAGLATAYVVLAGGYIAVSGLLARTWATDIDELLEIELVKGFAYVLVSGGLLFGGVLALMRRLAHQRDALAVAREALLEADRRAAAGLLAASVAHDLNNVLTVLQAVAFEIDESPGAIEERARSDMHAALGRATALAARLMTAGVDSATGSPRRVDLGAAVRESVDLVSRHRAVRGCTVEVQAEPGVVVHAYPLLVHQVVANLVINAGEAAGPGCPVEVRVAATEEGATLEVHDGGPGIPVEQRERVFQPFHSTKERGSGLGLLSVRICAELHGGRASIEDSPLGGACVRVELRGAVSPDLVANDADWLMA